MDAKTLKTRIKVCMFDQYGTVVDMQKGLTQVVTPYLQNKGWTGKPDSFVTWWRRTHFENSMIDALLHKEHTPYREIGMIAVLSNGDPDMLEAAKPFHGIAFDAVISVAVANSFKPHMCTYTKAAQIMGVKMDEVLFVANHAFDCIGAKAAGMHTAFIDRRSRPFGITPHQPDIVAPDMKGVADVLA
jgi:2-haloacid dehalogenase